MTEGIGNKIAQIFILWAIISFFVGGSVATGGAMLCAHFTAEKVED